MPPSRRKKSFVWKYFRVSEEDEKYAICNICGIRLNRGKDTRNYSTSPLAFHLRKCVKIDMKKKKPKEEDGDSIVKIDGTNHEASKLQEDVGNSEDINLSQTSEMSSEQENFVDRIDTDANVPDTSKEEYVVPGTKCERTEVICSRKMDIIHSGMLMHTLYQQHRYGKLCDLTLISAPAGDTRIVTQSEDATFVASKTVQRKKSFKAHSFVLAALSKKVKTIIEMGSRTIELKEVSPSGLKLLLEIVYTGKLLRTTLGTSEIHEIWTAAGNLGLEYVRNYLIREYPQVEKSIGNEHGEDEEKWAEFEGGVLLSREDGDDLIDMTGDFKNRLLEDDYGLPQTEETSTLYEDSSFQNQKEFETSRKEGDSALVEITFTK